MPEVVFGLGKSTDHVAAITEKLLERAQNVLITRTTPEMAERLLNEHEGGEYFPLSGAVRYWNTGSWIYEPDLTSRQAYIQYLQRAWPGTAVLIDTDEPHPRLLSLREHLNPLNQAGFGDGATA